LIKKLLAFAVIILFVYLCITPSFAVDNVKKTSVPVSSGNTFYVGGSGPGNYTRIQDAIDNATDGDTVFVYDDSSPYYENVFVNKSLTLRGEDKNTTIIDGVGDVGFNITNNDTFINGFTIKNCAFGISLLYNKIEISNITISNNTIYNCGHGILLVNSTNTYILSNIIFNNLGNSIFIQKCNNSHVKNNLFYNNSQNGITIKRSSNCSIFSNNIYSNLDLGISIIDSSQNNSVSRNNINNNSDKGIYVDESSSNNSFYHNNFVDNTRAVNN
jgi:nitrous oxidase accessory protein